MSSIQERLQLKRVPLDTWNIREKLCLASAVVRSGDQNWMSVSRSLKTIGDPNRPPDWYSQKSCAAQYGALLEHVETPKRKKRSSEGAAETPQESILKRLTEERIAEIQENVAEINRQYEVLKNEINEARNPNTSEDRLREMWADIEAAKRARERENARRAAWLKEREEKRARAERTWRPPAQPGGAGVAAPSSPLLTSLLKSSPVVTTPQNISHPANVIETVSPSAGAPTLSMLLESREKSGGGTPRPISPENKHAAIEHIKSQLVQIERQLKEKTSTPPPEPLPAPAVDIDDIEIKAEDVYAFRDIDLHDIPPVASMHKSGSRPAEKMNKINDEEVIVVNEAIQEQPVEEIKMDPPLAPSSPLRASPLPPSPVLQTIQTDTIATPVTVPDTVSVSDTLSIGFPTPEIKVIPSEEQMPSEPKDGAVDNKIDVDEDVNVEDIVEKNSEQQAIQPEQPQQPEQTVLPENVPEQIAVEAVEQQPIDVTAPAEIETAVQSTDPPLPQETPTQEKEIKQELIEVKIEERVATTEELVETLPEVKEDEVQEEIVKEVVDEKENRKSSVEPPPETEIKKEVPVEGEESHQETHQETDDDTPMEVSREEEKDGRKRRDYSRVKKPSSRTCSGSESAEASAPESPGGDAERQHRLWKKSVMLVYSRLCAHKYASLFLRPITDDEAPGYSIVVKRPMDLSTIRKNIENGAVRTTEEFHRDVMLMLTNALMYNSSEHSVYAMAKQMMEEAQNQLSMLVAAQAHAGLEPAPPARRKRRTPASPQLTPKRVA